MNFRENEDYLNFRKALKFVIEVEGIKFTDDPVDRGGKTKYGISQAAYPHLDIATLTPEQAEEIYYTDYWWAIACDRLDLPDALLVFDSAVQHGVPRTLSWSKNIKNWHDLIDIRRTFYKKIIAGDPTQVRFKNGWNNRLELLEQEYQKLKECAECPNGDPNDNTECCRGPS